MTHYNFTDRLRRGLQRDKLLREIFRRTNQR